MDDMMKKPGNDNVPTGDVVWNCDDTVANLHFLCLSVSVSIIKQKNDKW